MSLVFLNDRAVRSATAFGSLNTGSMVFIKKLTASSSATLSFVDGTSSVVLDSTYKEYLFTFNNIHAASDQVHFQFNMSVDGGSNYNVTKTTTAFRAGNYENDSSTAFSYLTSADLAQGTGFQNLEEGASMGNDNDQCCSGSLHLFDPSNTTFVKHFTGLSNINGGDNISTTSYSAGYFNTTTAITRVQFKFGSGNIDAGTIQMFGVL